MASVVRDNPAAQRFELANGDTVAGTETDELPVANYRIDGDVVTFTHTFVPAALRGHGVATRLVEAALRAARERHLTVVPSCRMFAAYMTSHPETHDLLTKDARRELGL